MIKRGEIVMDAPYQRGIVWEASKMSELIDSILNNYYIPPLLFVVRQIRGTRVRIVIDGKQRVTSTSRFMNNLIPYIDNTTTRPIHRFYSDYYDDTTTLDKEEEALRGQVKPVNFLTQEMFDKFNDFEFVCVEYSDIAEDDEFEIFSRVQLGKAITSAEKLKSLNSATAKLCREYLSRYSSIGELLYKRDQATLFQAFCQILYAIQLENPHDFRCTSKALIEFSGSTYVPTPTVTDQFLKALDVFDRIVKSSAARTEILRISNKKFSFKVLEMILFGKYVSLVQRARPIESYVSDLISMKTFLNEKIEGRLYLGKEQFLIGMEWVDSQLDSQNLRAVVQVQPLLYDEDEKDELKYDESESELSYPSPPTKRRNPYNVPVARRGGKRPQVPRRM